MITRVVEPAPLGGEQWGQRKWKEKKALPAATKRKIEYGY
jgi:hypothetical protein